MNREIRWFELRIELLQIHLHQQYQRIMEQNETERLLEVEHQKEKDRAVLSTRLPTALEWLALIRRQAGETQELKKKNSQLRSSLFAHQQQELHSFTDLITQQKKLNY